MICFKRKMHKEEWMLHIGLFAVAVILGLLFELHFCLIIVIGIVYLLFAPQILFNHNKFVYETQRFRDANTYMSQMTQSFIRTRDVIASLRETTIYFSNGDMRETLAQALMIIEEGKSDIKQAEKEALGYIGKCYSCEKIHMLHRYFIHAEEIGGVCEKEFLILEKMRLMWEEVIEAGRLKRFWERNIGAILFLMFLSVAIIMLRIMRNSNLDIMGLLATQMVDVLLLVGFILYFIFMDNRLNKSLLMDLVFITDEKVKVYYEYLNNYNKVNERRKYRSIRILSVVGAILLVYVSSSWLMLIVAIGLVFVGCNIHKIVYVIAKANMKRETIKAFPMWLFDMILLLQRESVESAFEKSIETAPPVLKPEIKRMNKKLFFEPHDEEAYRSFLKDFGNQHIHETMQKLYSLAVGINHNENTLDVIIEENMSNLENAEREAILFRDTIKNGTWIPFICAGFGYLAYLVIAIMNSINQIIQLI